MKIQLITRKIIRPCLGLIPVDHMGDEHLAKARDGTEFFTELKSHLPITLKQIRTAWWLASQLADNDPAHRFFDREDAMDYLMVKQRLGKTWRDPVTQTWITGAKSIRDLSREELSAFIERSLDILTGELGASRPDVVAQILEAIGSN